MYTNHYFRFKKNIPLAREVISVAIYKFRTITRFSVKRSYKSSVKQIFFQLNTPKNSWYRVVENLKIIAFQENWSIGSGITYILGWFIGGLKLLKLAEPLKAIAK